MKIKQKEIRGRNKLGDYRKKIKDTNGINKIISIRKFKQEIQIKIKLSLKYSKIGIKY